MRSLTGQPGTTLSPPGNVVPGLAPGASIRARKCFFPASSWVHAFILTCDGKLAVWFKRRRRHARGGVPGACCLYPQSDEALYDLAVTWWSAGHFVHRFLYRILAYQLVQPPRAPCGGDCPGGGSGGVSSGCCPGTDLPAVLHATVTGGGSCNGSYPLATIGSPTWQYTGPLGNCPLGQVNFTCAPGNAWSLSAAGPTFYSPSASSCTPLSVTFTGVDLTACGGGGGATVTVTA